MKKILLDSNSYFRLADNLYPLLSRVFGKANKYKLTILGGTVHEYYYQTRLQSKFDWVEHDRHKEDRNKNKLRINSPDIKNHVDDTKQIMMETNLDLELGCSWFDIECLATAYELDIQLVTDDADLLILAEEFQVHCFSTLELLKKMLDEEDIGMKNIQATVLMWDYLDDFPKNFENDFRTLFNEEPRRH
ncbi:MAG: DNA-binding protein [Spirochaetaceae bacterium]|nr:MAG: DNA-binding protein [Spirochaetaceae bacterium]